jgi:hypothetical protein
MTQSSPCARSANNSAHRLSMKHGRFRTSIIHNTVQALTHTNVSVSASSEEYSVMGAICEVQTLLCSNTLTLTESGEENRTSKAIGRPSYDKTTITLATKYFSLSVMADAPIEGMALICFAYNSTFN